MENGQYIYLLVQSTTDLVMVDLVIIFKLHHGQPLANNKIEKFSNKCLETNGCIHLFQPQPIKYLESWVDKKHVKILKRHLFLAKKFSSRKLFQK